MPAYYDKEHRYWRAVFRCKKRDGTVKQQTKRGFRTKKEAEAYIVEQKKAMETDLGMNVATFVTEKYMPDIKFKVKERTYMTKEHMIRTHILSQPIARMSMNEVKAQDIIQWQNSILEKGYSDCYNRTLNNQIVAIFLHAVNLYDLPKSPCKGIPKIGRADAEKQMLRYWTKDEFDCFMDSIDEQKDVMYHILFQLQYYCGFRIGDEHVIIRLKLDKPSKYAGLS